MPFIKLDCGIIHSTLWIDKPAREVFITSLLMATPVELPEAQPQLEVRSLTPTGWTVPAGWYGFVAAAGPAIVHQAGVSLEEGMAALERNCAPDPESRSPQHEGRRMARIAGGYVVLNFDTYRSKDYTNAVRQKRHRERNSVEKTPREAGKKPRKTNDIDFDIFWQAYPRKVAKEAARRMWNRIAMTAPLLDQILTAVEQHALSQQWQKDDGRFIPHASTWLHQQRWTDEIGKPSRLAKDTQEIQKGWQAVRPQKVESNIPVEETSQTKDNELF